MISPQKTSVQSLTRIAARGSAWLYSSSVLVMVSALVAQVVLGWLLSEADFGVYALAIAATNFMQVFRDGGVALWLSRRPETDFDQHASPAFWLALAAAFSVAVALIAAAPILARVYDEPQLTLIIWLFAVALPIDAFGVVAEAQLQAALRFRKLSQFRVLSALVRYTLIIAFALAGFGPLSFALPSIPLQLFRSGWLYYHTRLRPWTAPPSLAAAGRILRESGWAMGGAVASALLRQIDYLVLGLVAATSTVGVYFFAYQLAFQPVLVFSQSIRRVVVPTFALVTHQPDRQQRAVRRGAIFIGVVASFFILGCGLLMPGIEQFLWRGRWAQAVRPIQLLMLAMPVHLLSLFVRMVVQSIGNFRLWTIAVALRGVGLGLVVAATSQIADPDTVDPFAAAVAVYMIGSGVAEAYWLLRSVKIAARGWLLHALIPYGYLTVVAMLTQNASDQLLHLPLGTHMSVVGISYSLLAGVGLWLLCQPQCRELLATLSGGRGGE